MATDIRIPDDRFEESRAHEFRESLQPGQFRLKETLILMGITCAIMGGVRAIITHADKPSTAVIHSKP